MKINFYKDRYLYSAWVALGIILILTVTLKSRMLFLFFDVLLFATFIWMIVIIFHRIQHGQQQEETTNNENNQNGPENK